MVSVVTGMSAVLILNRSRERLVCLASNDIGRGLLINCSMVSEWSEFSIISA